MCNTITDFTANLDVLRATDATHLFCSSFVRPLPCTERTVDNLFRIHAVDRTEKRNLTVNLLKAYN